MIDPATGWFEIHQYDDKRAITVANIAEEEWFSRYPWPTQVTYDRGTEFIGQEFHSQLLFNQVLQATISIVHATQNAKIPKHGI
jgi:hypothetical protein